MAQQDFGQVLSGVGSSFGVGLQVVIFVLIFITIAVVIGGLIIYFLWNKKRWNLQIEIKLVRSNGEFVGGEWGKGMYDSKKGFVYIKRPGLRRKYSMKVFDIRRYLQGTNLLTVLQLGPEDFRPVLMHSFTKYLTEKETGDGKTETVKEAVVNIKIDKGDTKAWRQAFESAAKKAYSLQSFFQQYQVPIAIAIVIIAIFVGFAIIWARLPTICGR